MTDLEELLATTEPVRRRRTSKGAILLAVLLVTALTVALGVLFTGLDDVPGGREQTVEEIDYPGPASVQVTVVEVKPGETLTQIGQSMAAAGVVKTTQAFTDVARHSEAAQRIQPGFYTLHLYQPGEAALAEILSPQSRQGSRAVVPEGLTLQQTYQVVSQASGIPVADIEAAAAARTQQGLPLGATSLEGMLAPGAYDFDPRLGAAGVINRMVERFETETLPLLTQGGGDPYQKLIIASIVEEEAGVAADRGKVARVVVNRLAEGMRLQMDSTVNYARGDAKAHLSTNDLEVVSPYNTYRNTGLPPTPISSPSAGSIEAANAPEPGTWLYFVASGGGASTFTTSYDEFLAAKQKAQAEGVY